MEAIIAEHEKSFEDVCDCANQLGAGDHMRSGDLLVAKVKELKQQWYELKAETEKRQLTLAQAQLAQEVMCVLLNVLYVLYVYIYMQDVHIHMYVRMYVHTYVHIIW